MKLVAFLIGLASIFVGVYVFYTYSPYESGLFPRCSIYVTTGYQCTGCGSQRAIHDLLHFRLLSAFKANALVVLCIPVLLLSFISYRYKAASCLGLRINNYLLGTKTIWVILGILIVFTVCRNMV